MSKQTDQDKLRKYDQMAQDSYMFGRVLAMLEKGKSNEEIGQMLETFPHYKKEGQRLQGYKV